MKNLMIVVIAMFVSMSTFAQYSERGHVEGVKGKKLVYTFVGHSKKLTMQKLNAETCEVAVRSVEMILESMGRKRGIDFEVTEVNDTKKIYRRSIVQHNRFGAQTPLVIECDKRYK